MQERALASPARFEAQPTCRRICKPIMEGPRSPRRMQLSQPLGGGGQRGLKGCRKPHGYSRSLSVCLSVSMIICLFVCVCVCLSLCLFVFMCMSICMCLSVFIFFNLPFYPGHCVSWDESSRGVGTRRAQTREPSPPRPTLDIAAQVLRLGECFRNPSP